MTNLRRTFTKEKDIVIGRVKPNGRCKKHPKHHQSPGVCSLCLREKLTQLSASTSRRTTTTTTSACSSSSSSSSYYSSSSASSCASPMHRFRFTNEGKRTDNSVSFFLLSDREGGVDHAHNKSARRSGFWFKLLHLKSKRMEEKDTKLVRSMSKRETMKDRGR